jgi:hypothetical protein
MYVCMFVRVCVYIAVQQLLDGLGDFDGSGASLQNVRMYGCTFVCMYVYICIAIQQLLDVLGEFEGSRVSMHMHACVDNFAHIQDTKA